MFVKIYIITALMTHNFYTRLLSLLLKHDLQILEWAVDLNVPRYNNSNTQKRDKLLHIHNSIY